MPAVTFGVLTWPDTILDELARVLAALSGFTPDRVFESLSGDDQHAASPPASEFFAYRPVSLAPHPPAVTGGGDTTTVVRMQLRVALFARQGEDQELRDYRLLRARSRSLLRLQLRVVKALQMWRPLDNDGACILCEPARLVRGPQFEPVRAGRAAGAWAVSATEWETVFRADLT